MNERNFTRRELAEQIEQAIAERLESRIEAADAVHEARWEGVEDSDWSTETPCNERPLIHTPYTPSKEAQHHREYLQLLAKYRDLDTKLQVELRKACQIIDTENRTHIAAIDRERHSIHEQLTLLGREMGKTPLVVRTDILADQPLDAYGLPEFSLEPRENLFYPHDCNTWIIPEVEGGADYPRVDEVFILFQSEVDLYEERESLEDNQELPRAEYRSFDGLIRMIEERIDATRERINIARAKQFAQFFKAGRYIQAPYCNHWHEEWDSSNPDHIITTMVPDGISFAIGVAVPVTEFEAAVEALRKNRASFSVSPQFYAQNDQQQLEQARLQIEDLRKQKAWDAEYKQLRRQQRGY